MDCFGVSGDFIISVVVEVCDYVVIVCRRRGFFVNVVVVGFVCCKLRGVVVDNSFIFFGGLEEGRVFV